VETSLSQIAAEALDIPMEWITVLHGSTTFLKEGFGSFHSRTVVVGGSAVLDGAHNLKQRLREELRLSYGDRSLSLQDFPGLGVEGTFASHHHTYAPGTAAAHVAVDPETGVVEVIDYVMVEDVGRIINPLTLSGQSMGGVVQGMGGTFCENLAYDEHGQLLAGSLMDYALPIAKDFPNFRVFEREYSPSPNNPLGAKGAADGGIVPVAAVIGNAVASALAPLGVEINDLPLSPHNLWKLIHKKNGAARAS
jgi:aerobic carbon-monoxide dehydrogenase large subunit